MKIWCVGREWDEPFGFEFQGARPPRMLAIPERVDGHERLREFALLKDSIDAAVYLETPESAQRKRLAA
jgi:hypothetical protein